MRSIPIVSTLVVLLAVGVMIALGLWQLERREEKAQLLAHYAGAAGLTQEIAWPRQGPGAQLLYRRAHLTCTAVTATSAVAGRNRNDETGFARTATCALAGGGEARVVLGWTRRPDGKGTWQGGEVHGVIAPGPRLVADPALGGLEANALPDPSDLPNNHLSYAVQWFSFALTALVIYAMVLRRKGRS
ncbi:SURF1 family cytochrome oxidase biogenesis protein [Novosphingobium decolorationis]|uniref:SURF1-like protein n=1 Tax=Novosphingobium decolorationis TaxID=2698673 RepID=A0ABX8E7U5_9SPHN|nr:SURF1 family protein [Novosphingobium decolorationis]QVM84281.1 SURF1 family protein [Novosphingobium decolorationis]